MHRSLRIGLTMSTAQSLAPDNAARVRRRLMTAAVAMVAFMVGGSLIAVTAARTYYLSSQIEAAYAIWNDAQLVVFVHSGVLGGSSTLLEQLRAQTNTPRGIHATTQWMRWTNLTHVVRYEDGVATPRTYFMLDRDAADGFLFGPRPRFVNGRALVVAGFWNGHAIERLPAQEYARLSRDPAADDPGGWHWSELLQPSSALDLPVQVRGETGTLRALRSNVAASIELLRAGAPPIRLFDVKLGPRAVSGAAYASILDAKPSP
jgi:hypothetical protein